MRQESTKEPAFEPGLGWILCRGSWLKKGIEPECASKLAFRYQSPFSVCFANPQGVALRTAALVACAKGFAAAAADSEARSFRRSETAILRGRYHTSSRQAPTAMPSRRTKCAEKERGDHRGERARIRGIHSLFLLACRNKSTKRLLFGWVLGRGFGLQSRLPNVPLSIRPK